MKTNLAAIPIALLLAGTALFAQQNPIQIDANGLTQTLTAGGVVTRGQIVKINSAGQVVPVLTTDTSGAIGVAATSQTSAGNGIAVSIQGTPLVQIDSGGCAVGNVVSISTLAGGSGHCAATASGQQIGFAISISSPGSNFWNVQLALGGAGGGAIVPGVANTNYFYANDPKYGAKFDVQYAGNLGVTNGSTTVTSGPNDPPFNAATDIGKTIFGYCGGGDTQVRCPPQGTITAVNGAHSVIVSNAPVNPPGNVGVGGFGHDDTTALQAAFNASLFVGCVILPAGNTFFSAPPFISTASLPSGIFYGNPACIIGQHNTNLTPLPNFNVSSCNVAQTTCFFFFNNAQNTSPNFSLLKDFAIFSPVATGYPLTGNFTGYTWVNANRVMSFNLWIWSLGNSLDTGIRFTGPNYFHGLTVFNTGSLAGCSAVGLGGTSAGANQMNTMEQSYCKSAGPTSPSLNIGTNAALTSLAGQFDTAQGVSAAIVNDGVFRSYGEVIFNGGGAQESIKTTANGKTYLHDTWVIGQANNTQGAVGCSTSGGYTLLVGSNIDGGTGGVAVRNVAGCTVNFGPGNKFIQGTFSLAGPTPGLSNTGDAGLCATGNFALTSGWGTSTVASVAANGSILGCHVTITGAAGAAGPVLTWTYPAAPIAAPGSCHLVGVSGTLTGVATGTPGATTVAFTFAGTPSAQTYVFDVGCP